MAQKVYIVFDGDYDGVWVKAVCASRELADEWIAADNRRQWQELVDRAGQPNPSTRRANWFVRYKDGKVVERRVDDEFDPFPHPGPFDEWAKGHNAGYWIDEHDLVIG